MEQVEIVCLSEEISDGFYALAAEYLPDSNQGRMRERAEMFPKAFIALVTDGEVIGTAFGWERKIDVPEDDSFVLNGIAVRSEFQKNGYGKLLLAEFEKAAKGYGAETVSMGSAGGYVEKFYIDCGYTPKEYKVWIDGLPCIEKTFAGLEEYYSYERKNPDGFIVMEKKI